MSNSLGLFLLLALACCMISAEKLNEKLALLKLKDSLRKGLRTKKSPLLPLIFNICIKARAMPSCASLAPRTWWDAATLTTGAACLRANAL